MVGRSVSCGYLALVSRGMGESLDGSLSEEQALWKAASQLMISSNVLYSEDRQIDAVCPSVFT